MGSFILGRAARTVSGVNELLFSFGGKIMKDVWCGYDEAYTKSDAEDIGFCANCKISSCEKSSVSSDTDLKEKLIAALINELGTGQGRPKRIRKVIERIL